MRLFILMLISSMANAAFAVDIQLANLKNTIPGERLVLAGYTPTPTYVFKASNGVDVLISCSKEALLSRPMMFVGVRLNPNDNSKNQFEAAMRVPSVEGCDQMVALMANGSFPQTMRLSSSDDRNEVHYFYRQIEFLK